MRLALVLGSVLTSLTGCTVGTVHLDEVGNATIDVVRTQIADNTDLSWHDSIDALDQHAPPTDSPKWRIDVSLQNFDWDASSETPACVKLSSSATVTLDGVPMTILTRGDYDSAFDRCYYASFELPDAPVDDALATSTLEIADHGSLVRVEVDGLMGSHELAWEGLDNGLLIPGSAVSFEVLGVLPGADLSEFNPIRLHSLTSTAVHDVCWENNTSGLCEPTLVIDGARGSFVVPQLEDSGSWGIELPHLHLPTRGDGAFDAMAATTLEAQVLEAQGVAR